MKISQLRNVHATALALCAAFAAAPAPAATLLANYTLDFKQPPSPNCTATALGDLSGATLGGALRFATLDSAGAMVEIQPGPPTIGGIACGVSYSGSFSFDAPGISPGVSVSFGGLVEKSPGPPSLPLYAFFSGGAYDVGTLTMSVQSVPIPAATWLFGSGLLGLISIARIKWLRQNAAAM